jgi:hypothetical protein
MKLYDSVIPSHGELSPVLSKVNQYAEQIIAIEKNSSGSGEGWKCSDFGAMVKVPLQAFKLTGVAKERRIEFGIALDAAPLTKTLSLFAVFIIICDPDEIYPKMGKNISNLFSRDPMFTIVSNSRDY